MKRKGGEGKGREENRPDRIGQNDAEKEMELDAAIGVPDRRTDAPTCTDASECQKKI